MFVAIKDDFTIDEILIAIKWVDIDTSLGPDKILTFAFKEARMNLLDISGYRKDVKNCTTIIIIIVSYEESSITL